MLASSFSSLHVGVGLLRTEIWQHTPENRQSSRRLPVQLGEDRPRQPFQEVKGTRRRSCHPGHMILREVEVQKMKSKEALVVLYCIAILYCKIVILP